MLEPLESNILLHVRQTLVFTDQERLVLEGNLGERKMNHSPMKWPQVLVCR